MEVEVMSGLVSNLGFPIMCVVALFWQMTEERKAHKSESDKWVEAYNHTTEAIVHNTEVMQRVLDKLGGAP